MKSQSVIRPSNRPPHSLAAALKVIAAQLKIDPGLLRSQDRSWEVSRVRTLVSYVLVRQLGFPVGEVAAQFGRDGSTLSALLNRFMDRTRTNRRLMQQVEKLSRDL